MTEGKGKINVNWVLTSFASNWALQQLSGPHETPKSPLTSYHPPDNTPGPPNNFTISADPGTPPKTPATPMSPPGDDLERQTLDSLEGLTSVVSVPYFDIIYNSLVFYMILGSL